MVEAVSIEIALERLQAREVLQRKVPQQETPIIARQDRQVLEEAVAIQLLHAAAAVVVADVQGEVVAEAAVVHQVVAVAEEDNFNVKIT
jgi:hypothetical protein